jgi:hemerythrin-like domain-containing protein
MTKEDGMKPIGPLMIEHRLIERMVALLSGALEAMKQKREVNTDLINAGVDFFRTYADRTHHGKEEEIFFKELSMKELSAEDKTMMERLIQEHIWARQAVTKLAAAHARYAGGERDALQEMIYEIEKIVVFYPVHIEKEDKNFFLPVMNYFSKREQDAMLEEFRVFDRGMIHEKYRNMVEEEEKAH